MNQKGLTKIITLGIICAISVVILSYALVFNNSNKSYSTIFERPPLEKSDATYNNGPVDYDYENKVEVDYFACEKSSDCMIIKNSLCGCAEGDRNTVINKKYKERWNARIDVYTICDLSYNDHISCRVDSFAACIKGECQLVY